jgi:multisubunit Na+/H+ antiporter MnhB subunit
MKTHEPHSSAKAVIAFLVLAIAFVIFYKFYQNQNFFFEDPEAMRSYVLTAIAGGAFLIGLLYLVGNSEHKPTKKSSKRKKK